MCRTPPHTIFGPQIDHLGYISGRHVSPDHDIIFFGLLTLLNLCQVMMMKGIYFHVRIYPYVSLIYLSSHKVNFRENLQNQTP